MRKLTITDWLRAGVTLLALLFTGKSLATSYIYQPLKLPRAEDVVAFANSVNDPLPHRRVSRDLVLKFLSKGKNNLNVDAWFALENKGDSDVNRPTGVFTDKNKKVYFWTLCQSGVLKIISADHEQALIQLDR